jgi:hypothetical protein
VSASTPEATSDYSTKVRASRGVGALFAVALAGAVLCVLATFATVIRVEVPGKVVASYSGLDRHSVALLVIGLFAVPMAWGALQGARPAMGALAACGAAVLLIALLGDLPHLDDAGVWPQADAYEDARAGAGAGWYLETAGGVLLLATGALFGLARAAPRGAGARAGRATRPPGGPPSPR